MVKFKEQHSFAERKDEADRIMLKYPDRIPVICEPINIKPTTPILDKNKYLIPNDLTLGQFMYVIRKRMALSAEKAIYLFVHGTIPSSSELINNLYYYYRDEDGFLYISYASENVFG